MFKEMHFRERQKRSRCGGAQEIGPSERFIGNEDYVGVRVDVLWLKSVSIMDLASQLPIDCGAHDLVFLLFFFLSINLPPTYGRQRRIVF